VICTLGPHRDVFARPTAIAESDFQLDGAHEPMPTPREQGLGHCGLSCPHEPMPTSHGLGHGHNIQEQDDIHVKRQRCILVVKCGNLSGGNGVAAEAVEARRRKLPSMGEALQETADSWNAEGASLPYAWGWGTGMQLHSEHCAAPGFISCRLTIRGACCPMRLWGCAASEFKGCTRSTVLSWSR